jgi:hypothetical protein
MAEEKTLLEMLYVGEIAIDVGYDMSTPAAKTETNYLGAPELGGDISVTLHEYFDGESEFEGDPPADSVEMWAKLLVQMRDMLARCFVLGTMKVVQGGLFYGELWDEPRENLETAMQSFDEDFYEITLEKAGKAIRAREAEHERIVGGFKAMKMIADSVKKHPFERITMGEVFDRLKEKKDD